MAMERNCFENSMWKLLLYCFYCEMFFIVSLIRHCCWKGNILCSKHENSQSDIHWAEEANKHIN